MLLENTVYYHGLPKFLQSRLQVVQKKMIRYVLKYSNRTHLVANDFKWMSIENRIKYLAASHVLMNRLQSTSKFLKE